MNKFEFSNLKYEDTSKNSIEVTQLNRTRNRANSTAHNSHKSNHFQKIVTKIIEMNDISILQCYRFSKIKCNTMAKDKIISKRNIKSRDGHTTFFPLQT
jgi:hypothetical protein